MSWSNYHDMFNSFRTQYSKPKTYNKENDDQTSRNGLKPIRTFGRDISNLPATSAFSHDQYSQNSNKDYSKNVSKIGFTMLPKQSNGQQNLRVVNDFENGNVSTNGSSKPQKIESKFINLNKKSEDRTKKFKIMRQGPPKSKHHLYKRKIPVLKENRGISNLFSNTQNKLSSRQSVTK